MNGLYQSFMNIVEKSRFASMVTLIRLHRRNLDVVLADFALNADPPAHAAAPTTGAPTTSPAQAALSDAGGGVAWVAGMMIKAENPVQTCTIQAIIQPFPGASNAHAEAVAAGAANR
ncbi:hypothetical protein [Candidatus Accumulibacter contiguus]|jgi:hypothetical protein|uniref:hypothetical protein n=1 Tax=Candidatus Accumulibacter contiguus TaxID=2954381 RepID=UPI00145E8948|nr:hypothetical protein [Candidatus Accumulibacter contiguus]